MRRTSRCGGAAGYSRLRGMSETSLYPTMKCIREAASFHMSTPEQRCIGAPEQKYITDDGRKAPRGVPVLRPR